MAVYGKVDEENGFCRRLGKVDDDVHLYCHLLGLDKWGTARAYYTYLRP